MAISRLLITLHEIAALRRALKDGATILKKYSRGAMTGDSLINQLKRMSEVDIKIKDRGGFQAGGSAPGTKDGRK